MISIIVTAILGLAFGYYFGQNAAKKGKFYVDENGDNIPDFLQKGGRPKGSKNKKK